MPKRYNEEFKEITIMMYNQIQRGDTLLLDKTRITSIPQMLRMLNDLSSSTLYRWIEDKKIDAIVSNVSIQRDLQHNIKGLKINLDKSQEKIKMQQTSELLNIPGEDKLIIHGESRFIASLASIFQVPKYWDLSLEMMYLKLGLAFIEKSGLVPMDLFNSILKGGKIK